MPGVIGMLVNRIKSGLKVKAFKLFVASIIAVCMLFGIMPACESHAAFVQNIPVGGGIPNQSASLNVNGAAKTEKTKKQEDTENPNDLFANNPTLKQALYDSIKEYDADAALPGSVNNWHPKKADMENIKKLGISGKGISDINFLKYFPNLEELRLDNNKISDLKPLESLTKLKKLSIQNNGLTDISSISKVSTLKDLYLNGNQISDVSPISNLSNLEYLFIANNNISEIGSLAKIAKHNLRHIEAQSNHIDDFYKINNIIDCNDGQMFGAEPGVCTPFHNYMYDFSDQDIIVNLKSEDAQSGNYSIPKILGNIKNIYGYCKADRNFVNKCTGFEKSFKFTKFTNRELVKFTAVDSCHKHDDYYPLRYGQLFKNLSFLGFYLNFSGKIELCQYFPQEANITLKFGDKLTSDVLRKSIKVKNYPQDLFDKKYIDFSGSDEQNFKNFTSSIGVIYFDKPVKYDEDGYVISNSVSEDSVNVNVNVLNMAQTWPVKSNDVSIKAIDSSSKNPPAQPPTVDSIKKDVKNQVEGLFTTTSRLNYPLIPKGKTPSKCDLCDPDTDNCPSICSDDYDSDSGFGRDAIPTYRNDSGDDVPVFKNVGDSYKDCGQGGCGGPGSSAPKYYYKAPTVTVDDFKIPEATDKDQTVEVPVTVSYVDGSKCTFNASFTVKAKPQPNPPTPKPMPTPPTPQPKPQPQPQPQPVTPVPVPPKPVPQPQPVTPTPQPTPMPDPQNPPVTPAPAPTPDQPETPSGQSHMTEPEILPKPYLNIDVTPDLNIDVTPNNGSANSNTTNLYPNQRQDAARDGAAKNAEPSVTPTKGNKTGACANLKSHKSRGTIPATGSESSLIALVAMLSVLLGIVAICKYKFKQYIL